MTMRQFSEAIRDSSEAMTKEVINCFVFLYIADLITSSQDQKIFLLICGFATLLTGLQSEDNKKIGKGTAMLLTATLFMPADNYPSDEQTPSEDYRARQ